MSTDPTIPQPRVIVLCFDGTANQYNAANTNVVKFYSLLNKCCPLEQIVYYQPGVGTYFNPGIVSPALTWLAKIADEAVAWYLNVHVTGGYKFLMQNYRAGDKICIFGFSRGAYTARALAGFLFKIGLLPRDNDEQVPFAYNLYKREDNTGLQLAAGFKQTFCAPVTIDFLGVWDTVASVGVVYGRGLPFTSDNRAVRIFRHALSLDEHRSRFQPNLFHRESPQDAAKRKANPSLPVNSESLSDDERPRPRPRPRFGLTRWGIAVQRHSSDAPFGVFGIRRKTPGGPEPLVPKSTPQPGPSTVSSPSDPLPPVQEVWFAGCHSDVGGSSVADTVRYSLADIPLRWMVKQVILSQCGIKFDPTALRRADIDVSTIVLITPSQLVVEGRLATEAEASLPTPETSPGQEGASEYINPKGKVRETEEPSWPREQDVLADIHDQLKIKPAWWLLEILPMKFTWQGPDGTWKSKWGVNLGRGRQIRDLQPDFHSSVKERMGVADLHYTPRAKWTPGTERYVD